MTHFKFAFFGLGEFYSAALYCELMKMDRRSCRFYCEERRSMDFIGMAFIGNHDQYGRLITDYHTPYELSMRNNDVIKVVGFRSEKVDVKGRCQAIKPTNSLSRIQSWKLI